MYSQNDEEKYILDYFREIRGRFLDIGAFNGKDLSNTYALAERGWRGVCIEPSPEVFKDLQETHKNTQVNCFQLAIGTQTGKQKFHNNLNAVGTLVEEEILRWNGTENFNEIEVEVKTFKDWWQGEKYDFINIDAEGMDYEILTQIPLDEIGCKMLIVEWNSKEKEKYVEYMKGFTLLAENAENLIFIR